MGEQLELARRLAAARREAEPPSSVYATAVEEEEPFLTAQEGIPYALRPLQQSGKFDLERFVIAQETDNAYEKAILELDTIGRKVGHWMWFVFPQLAALGKSEMSKYYGISGLEEAMAYLRHNLLGPRYQEAMGSIYNSDKTAEEIFGRVDAKKLHASLTLFYMASGRADGFMTRLLDKFFGGELDRNTLAVLNRTVG